jgi:hypothetical protein
MDVRRAFSGETRSRAGLLQRAIVTTGGLTAGGVMVGGLVERAASAPSPAAPSAEAAAEPTSASSGSWLPLAVAEALGSLLVLSAGTVLARRREPQPAVVARPLATREELVAQAREREKHAQESN